MNELEAVKTLIKDLPQLGTVIVVCLCIYKVVFIGSVYGLIRYAIDAIKEMYLK